MSDTIATSKVVQPF